MYYIFRAFLMDFERKSQNITENIPIEKGCISFQLVLCDMWYHNMNHTNK